VEGYSFMGKNSLLTSHRQQRVVMGQETSSLGWSSPSLLSTISDGMTP
jgi:hypothetical protein